jgi:hypothetical protein
MSNQTFPAFVKELFINRFVFNFLSCTLAIGMMSFLLLISWIELFRGSQAAIVGIFATIYCVAYLLTILAKVLVKKFAENKK